MLSAVSTTACVTPSNAFTAYEDRTADADFTSTGSDDAGSDADTSAGAGFSDLTLVMACTSQEDVGQVAQASYFVVNTTFHEDGTTGNGTLDYSDTSLILGPNLGPPTNIANVAGSPPMPATATGAPVTDGRVSVSFGPTNIPTDASPLGVEIDFNNTTLNIIIQGGTLLCATLGGSVAEPQSIPMLTPSQNICVFKNPNADGSLPVFVDSEFVSCP